MSKNQRSVGQRLKKAKSQEAKTATITDWFNRNVAQHQSIINDLDLTIKSGDKLGQLDVIADLQGWHTKFNTGSNAIIEALNTLGVDEVNHD